MPKTIANCLVNPAIASKSGDVVTPASDRVSHTATRPASKPRPPREQPTSPSTISLCCSSAGELPLPFSLRKNPVCRPMAGRQLFTAMGGPSDVVNPVFITLSCYTGHPPQHSPAGLVQQMLPFLGHCPRGACIQCARCYTGIEKFQAVTQAQAAIAQCMFELEEACPGRCNPICNFGVVIAVH